MKSLEEKSSPIASSAKRKYFPSASFDTKAVPELKDAKDGDHHHILIKFKKTGSNTDNNRTRVHGEMVAAEYKGKAKGGKDDNEEQTEKSPDNEAQESY